ncbi:putative house-cleaning noncanonical NTP pyrophosphatase (MazG superfamily) [Hymenobacter luteus]|uniref:House-cleaning noncanonical NTP pyrophosphatase (MazG superfamily) n=2 Tax=Hymenobacter TaxID=89966 RepID=A0ABR6JVQ0_9BACT|nr:MULTISPECIES: nucleoside triphosphate pyrophosphohydrolase [Hymenobacter]MBB4600906.1 putative house-cleaning noncanonical NTP pyrophosphatase (MazG superfamily) [Hymenobacter latericoloratus]MBB6058887.1 putative house-cleaning noncanonical NTP pyrophosphatase (MazG superfamily) [Hymenobacter luteus]
MQYPKLIRDHIPAIIAQSGRQCRTETMNDEEYRQALRAKLVEEALEVQAASPQELPTELADVLEVFDALLAAHNLNEADVRAIQHTRRQERGGFSQQLKLLEIQP